MGGAICQIRGGAGAPPPPSTFTDDFNRSNRDLQGDNGWFREGALLVWKISTNQMFVDLSVSIAGDGLLLREATADVRIQSVFVAGSGTGASNGLVVREVNSGQHVLLDLSGNTMRLYSKTGGAYTLQGVPGAFAAGDLLALEAVGSVFRVLKNGVEVHSQTIAVASTTATKVGYRKDTAGGVGGIWDDYMETYL